MLDNRVLNDDNKTILGHRLSIERTAIFTLLNQLCSDNADYFSKANSWSGYSDRMVNVSADIQECAGKLRSLVTQLQDIAPSYDYDENTPGNGFRSLVCICDTTVLHLISLQKSVSEQRGSFVFRLAHYCKELEAFANVVHFLIDSLPVCIENQASMPSRSLFPPLDGSYDKYYEMLRALEQLDPTCFYGRPLGFQFSPSVNRIFRVIGIVLASYSLSWEKGHGPIGSIINTGRFFLSPEQRASRIVKVTKEADIDFCKGFWNLAELSNNMPKWFSPNMAINELREINWVGPITLETTQGGKVKIPEPTAHTGPRPVQIRILSPVHRPHMSPTGSSNQQPASPYIVFHCHGGGYVATSSKSHETYLRMWAKLLNCTVVSVEYSLAPENPFPRPTEEVMFAYAWVINNPHLVGWTGEKMCMVGDSAGGNLIMSVNLRLIELDVKKKPDGIVPVYTPFLFQYLPSPSRLLSVMDPLLHMGVVLRCVAAYTGGHGSLQKNEENQDNAGHKSLQEYVEQVQKSQRFDFAGGSQSIVSLVQNVKDPNEQTHPTEAGSFFVDKEKQERNIEEEVEEEGSEEDEDTRSVSSVHIGSDPLHIQLSSTIFDNQLLNYLIKHPTTKDSLTMVDENGEVIEDIDEGLMANPSVHEEKKRPGLLNVISGAASNTVPNTPCEGRAGIISSTSSNNFQNHASQVHKRSLSQSLADTAVLAAGHALDNLQDWFEKPSKEKQKLDRTVSHKEPLETEEPCVRKSFILDLLNKSSVPRDPLISPMYATDEVIRQLPPVYFVACHLDPLLDDTIAFAQRVQAAGGRVASMDLLPAVPHGFLNFTLMSPECRRGAKICLQRIKEALGYVENSVI
nr:Hormone-sensitive lipase and Alpha beta hydrolase fold-3 domain containing protein [Haemonchus contortus]